jgi:hypothetical protein
MAMHLLLLLQIAGRWARCTVKQHADAMRQDHHHHVTIHMMMMMMTIHAITSCWCKSTWSQKPMHNCHTQTP